MTRGSDDDAARSLNSEQERSMASLDNQVQQFNPFKDAMKSISRFIKRSGDLSSPPPESENRVVFNYNSSIYGLGIERRTLRDDLLRSRRPSPINPNDINECQKGAADNLNTRKNASFKNHDIPFFGPANARQQRTKFTQTKQKVFSDSSTVKLLHKLSARASKTPDFPQQRPGHRQPSNHSLIDSKS